MEAPAHCSLWNHLWKAAEMTLKEFAQSDLQDIEYILHPKYRRYIDDNKFPISVMKENFTFSLSILTTISPNFVLHGYPNKTDPDLDYIAFATKTTLWSVGTKQDLNDDVFFLESIRERFLAWPNHVYYSIRFKTREVLGGTLLDLLIRSSPIPGDYINDSRNIVTFTDI